MKFELGGDLKSNTLRKVRITDASLVVLSFYLDLCTIKNATMKRLCEEASTIESRCKNKELVKIVILGGYSCLDQSCISDIQNDTLLRNKKLIVDEYATKKKWTPKNLKKS